MQLSKHKELSSIYYRLKGALQIPTYWGVLWTCFDFWVYVFSTQSVLPSVVLTPPNLLKLAWFGKTDLLPNFLSYYAIIRQAGLDHSNGQFFSAMEWLMFIFSGHHRLRWFSMVLTPLDHHHWMFLEGPTIGFNGFSVVFEILRAMVNNGLHVPLH